MGPAVDDPDVGSVISARQRDVVAGYLALAAERGLQGVRLGWDAILSVYTWALVSIGWIAPQIASPR